ncbi:metallophosphoesterase [Ostreiculturibacter nitratireducens]|uniref:metallophosphoesterase n=1 Tax=Ostreiculturibacter nitratireducens TaxID=3075226 RepID=UPI0031B64D69
MRSYAIGDIHGHLDKLRAAHDLVAADRRAVGDDTAPVVHVGDLVDRGPDACGVIEHLIGGIASGLNWVVLKGNHDRMFSLFLDEEPRHDTGLRAGLAWLDPRLGGGITLASYGVTSADERPIAEVHAEARARVPKGHADFLANLPAWHLVGEALFVHAGIRPGVDLCHQSEDDLLWIRGDFLDDPHDHGPLVVHGHTPVSAVTHYGNRLNIDTGAAYGGPLSAVVIEGRAVWLLTDAGRVPILPAA